MFLFAPNPAKLKEKEDIQGLIKLLDHKKIEIRKQVAEILRDWAKPEAKDALLKALKDENQGVRVYAVQGLARLKDVSVESALQAAKQDPDWEVRKEALSALVKRGKNVEAMLEAIQFNSAELRELAAIRLGDVGSSEAVDALVVALNDEEELVRLRAVNALAKIKDVSALGALEQAVNDKDAQVSKAAQNAIAALQSK